jgi:uncharacterized membrane protein
MKKNVGNIDRMIRFVVAIVFIVIGFTVSYWWLIVAAIALATGILGTCGLYSVFNISTAAKKKPARHR